MVVRINADVVNENGIGLKVGPGIALEINGKVLNVGRGVAITVDGGSISVNGPLECTPGTRRIDFVIGQ